MGPIRKTRGCGLFIGEKLLIRNFITLFKNVMLLHEHWIVLSSHFFCSVNPTERTKRKKRKEKNVKRVYSF